MLHCKEAGVRLMLPLNMCLATIRIDDLGEAAKIYSSKKLATPHASALTRECVIVCVRILLMDQIESKWSGTG